MKLKYESEPLPEYLENKSFRCDVHCYDPALSYSLLELLRGKDIFRINASRMNATTGELYPNRQTFFIGDETILKTINSVIDESAVKGTWVDFKQEIDWNDYYNIDVSRPDSSYDKRIKYHQVV